MKKYTIDSFVKKFNNKFPNNNIDFSESIYNGSRNKITVICHNKFLNGEEHGKYITVPYKLMNQGGCKYCNCRNVYDINDFIREATIIHHNNYDYSKSIYKNSHSKIIIICNKCLHSFSQTPNAHLRGEGCPYCKIYKMEKEVEELLINNNFEYIKQYRIKEINNKPYDFYLPKHNILIECQGEQHFIPITFGGTEKDAINNHLMTKSADEIKYKIAKSNNIKIVYYVNTKLFHKENRKINIEDKFINDEIICRDIKELLNEISSK